MDRNPNRCSYPVIASGEPGRCLALVSSWGKRWEEKATRWSDVHAGGLPRSEGGDGGRRPDQQVVAASLDTVLHARPEKRNAFDHAGGGDAVCVVVVAAQHQALGPDGHQHRFTISEHALSWWTVQNAQAYVHGAGITS